MAKKRVHEIAKSQGMTSKEVLAKLQAAGLEVKAAASSVEESDALKALGGGNGAAPAEAPGAAAPAPPGRPPSAPRPGPPRPPPGRRRPARRRPPSLQPPLRRPGHPPPKAGLRTS